MIFLTMGILAHADNLTSDDFIERLKSVVDIDMDQEDQIKPLVDDFVSSVNKIYDTVQQGADKAAADQKFWGLARALDEKLGKVLTPDQIHLWVAQNRHVYKDIAPSIVSQNPYQ